MLLRFNASTTTLPFVVSPASTSTVLPDGEVMSSESPFIGPTSRTRTVSSPPEAGGGCVCNQGRTNLKYATAPAAATTRRTAIAHPQPRLARPISAFGAHGFVLAFVVRLGLACDSRRVFAVPASDA